MTFLDRVEEANRHDLSAFCRWRIGDVVAGHVRTDLKTRLADCSDVFRLVGDDLEVVPALDDVQSRTEAVDALLPQLREDGFVAGAVGEQYGVVAEVGATPLMAIDRGAVEAFGVIATGFHLNGLVADAMWVARRSRTKATFPGQLDNMVAGGWPLGLTMEQNVLKECGEEAGMPADLAATARPAGVMTYVMAGERGLRRHAMFLYDLEVPPDFEPVAVDGEVESFQLMPIDEVAAIVRDSAAFKFNSAVAVIDYLLRTGRISPDEPGLAEIRRGISMPLDPGVMAEG